MLKDRIYTIAGDGGPSRNAGLNLPNQVAIDSIGNLFIADGGNNAVKVISAKDGFQFGQNMQANTMYTAITVDAVAGLAVDKWDNIACTSSSLSSGNVKFRPSMDGNFFGKQMSAGDIYTLASGLQLPCYCCFDQDGNLFIAETNGNKITVIPRSSGLLWGHQATAGEAFSLDCTINAPYGITTDANGNLFVAQYDNNISIIPKATSTFFGRSLPGQTSTTITTTLGRALACPIGILVDPVGNLLIAESLGSRVSFFANRAYP
jgi:DNA-binding beta-propeller fold protein YncE